MKKWVCFLLITSMLLFLCACGKSPAVQETEALIDSIGEVTLDRAETIAAAQASFESLSEKEQISVENHELLEEAQTTLEELQEKDRTDITGSWSGSLYGQDMIYVFRADGTFEGFIQSTIYDGMSGTYTYDGSSLHLDSTTGNSSIKVKKEGNTLVFDLDTITVLFTRQS